MILVLQNVCPKAADLDVACTVGAYQVWYSLRRYAFWLSDGFFIIIGTIDTCIHNMHKHEHVQIRKTVWFGKEVGLIFYEIFKGRVLKLFSLSYALSHSLYCASMLSLSTSSSSFVLYRHCMLKNTCAWVELISCESWATAKKLLWYNYVLLILVNWRFDELNNI